MASSFIFDKIQVRSIEESGRKPRYNVKATGMIADKKHVYEYTKNKDGSYKTLKSLFTPNCLKSIKEQAKHKKIFVDVQHELARNAGIKTLVKDKLSAEEQLQLDNMLKRKMLPLAKINELNIYDDKLDLDIDMNSSLRDLDEDHKKFFDSVWYSLEHQFLNGVSANFADFKYTTDENGDTVIDDVEILGFSFLDSPAEMGNSIYEVAIRSIEEKKGGNMEKELEQERAKLAEERKAFEAMKAEEAKKTELSKQMDEHKKVQEALEAKSAELKKAEEERGKLQEELNRAKGVVPQRTNPNVPANNGRYSEKFYEENLKEVMRDHEHTISVLKSGKVPLVDNTMKGFGELVNLQAKISRTAGLSEENASLVANNRWLDRSKADIVVPKMVKYAES